MSPPTGLVDRVRLRLRSRRTIEADREAAEARALGWQRELLTERASHGRTRDLVAQSLGILTGPGIKVDVDSLVEVVRAVRGQARLVDGLRRECDGAQAHASHWRREVGALTGVQSEGMADSDLLARLRQVVDDGNRAQQVADRARDDEEAAYEAIRRIANALRPGSSGVRVDDLVEWAREATNADSLLASREALLAQSERFEAELIAVDEALAKAGATPADDRVQAIRALVDPAHVCTCGACNDRRARVDDAAWRAAHWDTHSLELTTARHGLGGYVIDPDVLVEDPCLCTGRKLGMVEHGGVGQSCVVDPRCPVHSPGYRFGGRPARPLALPPGTGPSGWPHDLPCDHQLIAYVGGDAVPLARCRWLAGHTGPHGNASGRTWFVEPARPVDDVVDATILDALDRWEGDATTGGWVCDACGRPVNGDDPCPEHQPLALADARAEADEVPF